jgi:hypothetical protein
MAKSKSLNGNGNGRVVKFIPKDAIVAERQAICAEWVARIEADPELADDVFIALTVSGKVFWNMSDYALANVIRAIVNEQCERLDDGIAVETGKCPECGETALKSGACKNSDCARGCSCEAPEQE